MIRSGEARTYIEAARRCGFTVDHVRRLCERAGVESRFAAARRERSREIQRAAKPAAVRAAWRRVLEGASVAVEAGYLGVDPSELRRRARDQGLPTRAAVESGNLGFPDFGSAIKEFRQARGLGSRELARRTGVASGAMSEIETGTRAPTLRTLVVVARALEIPLSDLVRRAEEMKHAR